MFIGQKHWQNHKKGKRLGVDEAALAKCYDCMGAYADGVMDCKTSDCPLYPWMPYRDIISEKNSSFTLCVKKKPLPIKGFKNPNEQNHGSIDNTIR